MEDFNRKFDQYFYLVAEVLFSRLSLTLLQSCLLNLSIPVWLMKWLSDFPLNHKARSHLFYIIPSLKNYTAPFHCALHPFNKVEGCLDQNCFVDFLGEPVVTASCFQCRRLSQSLVGELRSHILCGAAKNNFVFKFILSKNTNSKRWMNPKVPSSCIYNWCYYMGAPKCLRTDDWIKELWHIQRTVTQP